MSEEKKSVNGVAVSQLFETVEAVEQNPELAGFRFRVRNQWVDGGHNRTMIADFEGACETHRHERPFVFEADEPPLLLGQGKGANPVEYALTALAACVTTSIVYHAAAKGIRIRSLQSRLEGDLDVRGFLGVDENVRNGYQGVRMSFEIDADGSEEDLAEIVQLGPTYSPVYDIFTNPVPVSVGLAEKTTA